MAADVTAAVQKDGVQVLRPAETSQKGGAKGPNRFELQPAPGPLTSVRLELVPHKANGGSWLRTGQSTAGAIKVELAILKRGAAETTQLELHVADAPGKRPSYSN